MRTLTKVGRVVAAVVLGVLASLGAAVAPSQADVRIAALPADGTQFVLYNTNSGLCLVARGYAASAPVVSTTCNKLYDDQVWYTSKAPGSYGAQAKMIHNLNSSKCLLSPNHGGSAYRAVQTVCDSRYGDQVWIWDAFQQGSVVTYQLENWETGRCLVQRGYSSGTQAVTSGCSVSYADQLWIPIRRSDLP